MGQYFLGTSLYTNNKDIIISNVRFQNITISSDATKIVYLNQTLTEDNQRSFILYCRDLKTGKIIKLTKTGTAAIQPSLSPDNQRVAYYCSPDSKAFIMGTWSLCVVPVDGSVEPKVIAPPSIQN